MSRARATQRWDELLGRLAEPEQSFAQTTGTKDGLAVEWSHDGQLVARGENSDIENTGVQSDPDPKAP
ncbi:hypothetical protein ACPXB3_14595 [Gordonia sp. DT219]|uniref:hypothetical protein n=1 Tax=Gordonia sp. DT219 TaxID=3416658 RepID=UPI003CE841C0